MDSKNSSNPSSLSLYLVLLFSVLIGVCFGRFILNWKLHYKPEKAELTARKMLVIAAVNKAQTLRAREKEFDEEVQRLNQKLRDLYVQLPLSMGLESFMPEFQDRMNQIRIKVNDYKSEISTREDNLYSQCRITAILSSPIPLNEKIEFDRLLKWENRSENSPKVSFFIFSSDKKFKQDDQANPCLGLKDSKLIWPLSKRIKELRADLNIYCKQYALLQQYMGKVEILETLRNDLAKRSYIIEEINNVVKTPLVLSAPDSE